MQFQFMPQAIRKFGSEFNKNVLILVGGTGVAQGVPILLAPFLTRVYSPAEFGVFALYFSIVSIIAVGAAGRFELAITLPKSRKASFQITALSIFVALFTTFFLYILASLIYLSFAQNGDLNNYSWMLWVIPISVFATGVFNSLYYWNMREKSFSKMAKGRIIQNVGAVVVQLLLGWLLDLGAFGLIFGYLLGQLSAVLFLAWLFLRGARELKLNVGAMYILARQNINFPRYLLFGHTINAFARGLPNIVFNAIFSSASAGFYLLTLRVVGAPVSLLGSAVGDVFQQQASEAYAKRGECFAEYRGVVTKLVLISIIPFLIFATLSQELFAFVFGENWRAAGFYAQILTPMFFLQFITSPVGAMFWIARKHRADLYWQISLGVLTAIALYVGYLADDIVISLILFSTAYSIAYSAGAIMTFRFSRGT